MKISVIADSIAMPRMEPPDCVPFHEAWPNQLVVKLQKKLSDNIYLMNDSARKRISTSLKNRFYEVIECVDPKYVIIQIGIVDCAPRIVSMKEHYIYNRRFFPKKLREFIIVNRKKNRKKITEKDPMKKVYVKPDAYASNINAFLYKLYKFNSAIKVILFPIIADYSIIDAKSPGFKSNIKIYNNVLEQINHKNLLHLKFDSFISLMTESQNVYCSDGYHLSKNGHAVLADFLLNHLLKQ